MYIHKSRTLVVVVVDRLLIEFYNNILPTYNKSVVIRRFGRRIQSRATHRYGFHRHTPGVHDRLHMRVDIAVSQITVVVLGGFLRVKLNVFLCVIV